jgi:hypothetical protein
MKRYRAPKQILSAWQRVLHAHCGKTSHAGAGAWAEEHLGGLKSWPTSHDATPRSPQTLSARRRILHAYCSEGRHAVAGAWAEEPLGGLKTWPTSHDTTPRSPNAIVVRRRLRLIHPRQCGTRGGSVPVRAPRGVVRRRYTACPTSTSWCSRRQRTCTCAA